MVTWNIASDEVVLKSRGAKYLSGIVREAFNSPELNPRDNPRTFITFRDNDIDPDLFYIDGYARVDRGENIRVWYFPHSSKDKKTVFGPAHEIAVMSTGNFTFSSSKIYLKKV